MGIAAILVIVLCMCSLSLTDLDNGHPQTECRPLHPGREGDPTVGQSVPAGRHPRGGRGDHATDIAPHEREPQGDWPLGGYVCTLHTSLELFTLNSSNVKCFLHFLGCHKGRRVGYKCYLVYRTYETYAGAAQKCLERGGRMAMPRDRKEQEALADYVKAFFQPGNWPVWLGINDLLSEGLYLFEDNTRVTYFQWRKHFLSSQPDGGKRENCVAMASDDGDWWDNYCDRNMSYLCEFDA
uniref:C-type lectin domain containing 11A n=1 Tax=Oncorhynchus kisutch TaxID=8019 RepID=A0A8C7M665_ONCKI